ncbi:hypothetical protein [Photobacterium proteolyticum]|nr:hypothetical protein [Photobacterium proteolyticum]
MNIEALKALSIENRNVMPWLQGITSDKQYDELIAFMVHIPEYCDP